MKNILKIIICLLTITANSQEGVEVPLNSLSFEHPNGTYIKDFNNIFQPYIGIWKGEKYGKELILQFVKFTKQIITSPNGDYYYEDELMCKYQYKDITNNTIISTTMNAVNYEDYKILGLLKSLNGSYKFLFTDTVCYNTFDIIIENIPNISNQLKYVAHYSDFWDSPNCTYTNREDIPIPIPFKINMVLTKQ